MKNNYKKSTKISGITLIALVITVLNLKYIFSKTLLIFNKL